MLLFWFYKNLFFLVKVKKKANYYVIKCEILIINKNIIIRKLLERTVNLKTPASLVQRSSYPWKAISSKFCSLLREKTKNTITKTSSLGVPFS